MSPPARPWRGGHPPRLPRHQGRWSSSPDGEATITNAGATMLQAWSKWMLITRLETK